MYVRTNMIENRTVSLWQGFMPRRREITNNLNTDLIAMQVYDADHDFKNFNHAAFFEKWATVEVTDHNNLPAGMEAFTLQGGLYAIFHHKGNSPEAAQKTFRYIYETWLPASGYQLDNRPQFELLGAKFDRNNPDSEEDIYIPVRVTQ